MHNTTMNFYKAPAGNETDRQSNRSVSAMKRNPESSYASENSDGTQYRNPLNQNHLSKPEIIIADKLGYGWKVIFRTLTQSENNKNGCINLSEFDSTCYNNKVVFTKDELVRISKMAGVEDEDYNMRTFDTIDKGKLMINFRKLSAMLGIHKDSYNHVNTYKINTNRLMKLFKLREHSIEPINEEED